MQIEDLIQKLSFGTVSKVPLDTHNSKNFISREIVEAAVAENKSGYRPVFCGEKEQECIINAIRSRAKLAVIDKKREGLSNENIFFEFAKQFSDSGLTSMDYNAFKKQTELAPVSVKRFFSAANFMLFPRTKEGSISCEEFLR